MKPLSYINSFINLPSSEWNDLEISIWIYNGVKELGLLETFSNTKMLTIKNHEACLGDDFEYIKAVVVREDEVQAKQVKDYKIDDAGNILIPEGEYPVVQQTVNNQIMAIFPLLPHWFPNNTPETKTLWTWAEQSNVLFDKQCTECPTYCNNCEYVYNVDENGCLYFPQIKNGVTCVNYATVHKDVLIDETNTYLINALVDYVLYNYWEVKMNTDYSKQSRDLYELYRSRYLDAKKNARNKKLMNTLNINKIGRIMNPLFGK